MITQNNGKNEKRGNIDTLVSHDSTARSDFDLSPPVIFHLFKLMVPPSPPPLQVLGQFFFHMSHDEKYKAQ